MSLSTVMLLTAALLAAPAPAADSKAELARKDLENLQGDWVVVAVEENGEKQEAQNADTKIVFRIKGKAWSLKLGTDYQEFGQIDLDPTQKPKALNATMVEGEKKENARAIYDLDGDKLRVAYLRVEKGGGGDAEFGADRPRDFTMKPVASKAEPHLRVLVLKRAKAEK